MFLALSRGIRPDIGNKISSFIALAPAVYAGPVLRKFPFSLMRKFKGRTGWRLAFGGTFPELLRHCRAPVLTFAVLGLALQ